MEVKKHTIQLVVNNKPDVLARIAGTFSGRGFNIESITANITMNPDVTKINIVTTGDSRTATKIQNQLKKLVDVLQVSHVRETKYGQREMALIRIKLTQETKEEVEKAIEELNCRVITKKSDSCTVEVTGTGNEIDQALTRFGPLGLEDMSRSGIVAL
ncbi:MAG: acetolactate synthase small subunit [Deltaproteobacteria bacterium]|nr:acetolactate synthase small subunit [Deltaproteobacteria bacterium]